MDVKGLKFFLGVLRYKSITKAAEHLYIAQPALGLQVRKLELELGVQLFQRHSRGVTPTEAGLLLAEHAKVILQQVKRARQDLLDYAETPRGRVAIGLSPTTSQLLAAALAERIKDTYPEIALNISEGLSEQLMEWVGTARIDLALTYNPTSTGDVVVERLVKEELHFIRPVDGNSNSCAVHPIVLADTLAAPLVMPSRPHLLRLLVDDAVKSIGAKAEVAYEVDSVPLIREFIQRGFGCSILPLGAVRGAVEEGHLRANPIVEPEIKRTLYLAYSHARPPSRAFLATMALLRTVTKDIVATGTAGWHAEPELTSQSA
jgi:LysR family nitrogen assimilation transcriptional regulator